MLHNVSFVVPRQSSEEVTYAVVTAYVINEELSGESAFKEVLIKAVSEWVETTETGQAIWEHSNNDLNLGDLSMLLPDEELTAILAKVGIRELEIEVSSHSELCQDWAYDTVLVA